MRLLKHSTHLAERGHEKIRGGDVSQQCHYACNSCVHALRADGLGFGTRVEVLGFEMYRGMPLLIVEALVF